MLFLMLVDGEEKPNFNLIVTIFERSVEY